MSGRIKIKARREDSDTVYIALPGYPDPVRPGVVTKSVSLDDIYDYDGPRVQLDFDESGKLIGVEIVA
ncbi:MAG TPA: DUF2283 domain-containing protein [Pirellulaceae bacterium]|nr:DUF2283 domain-containing protein [Pirellulaceae bacterium]